MAEPINELINDLPERNLTTMALNALDFVVPGEWDNTIGWNHTIEVVTGATGDDINRISAKALELYADESRGYQTAVWLYRSTDDADAALGAAALADKVGGRIPLFGGLIDRLTPKADTVQSVDLALKIAVEVVAYCKLNGLPASNVGDFVTALQEEYQGAALMRAAGLVCFDGLIPLGPDFLDVITDKVSSLDPNHLSNNAVFKTIGKVIPGNSVESQLGFISTSVNAMKGWMGNLVESRGLTPQGITSNLQNFIELSDDKLDYLAAFIDMSTNYFEHTGLQTVARNLILDAQKELG
ncbi:MAG: hypothetical protein ACO4AI_13255 [Prochlorothrix sp.]|nr:hypothetical protein [Prochlorothrix sp.]